MARISEAEETVDSLNQKIASCEKSRARMQSDLGPILQSPVSAKLRFGQIYTSNFRQSSTQRNIYK
jgi:hypothetical protein